MRTQLTILTAVGVVVAALAAPGFVVAQQSESNTIDSCTTITEPGVYTVGADVTNSSAETCIQIESSDVHLYGENHTVSGDGEGVAVGATADDSTYSNVTVRNLNVDEWGTGFEFDGVEDATVENVSVDALIGVDLGATSGVAIRNSTVVTQGADNSLAGSARGTGIYLSGQSTNTTVVGNEIRNGDYGIEVATSVDNTIVRNDISENVYGVKVRVVDSFPNSENVVRSNDLTDNKFGVYVFATGASLVVRANDLSNNSNSGVVIAESSLCSPAAEGAELVSIHENNLAGTESGVRNLNQDIVNATSNYWGASDGPSSKRIPAHEPLEEPLEDPVTGTLADGNGSAVSDGWDGDGVSSVHFDTWLEHPPENVSSEA